MPFKSEAQKAKFEQLKSEGKMKQETIDKWDKETPKGKLPKRVTPEKIKSIKQIREKSQKKGY
jgi:hypothetical protein